MPLARIITRSQICSRELAMDLFARGYTVEIVSPDALPNDLADLELRVEEDPGNRLVATVQARHGARSQSLEFVHHLRAPMADFQRRIPETDEVAHLSEDPADPNVAPLMEVEMEPVQLLAEASPPLQPVAEGLNLFAEEVPTLSTISATTTPVIAATTPQPTATQPNPEPPQQHSPGEEPQWRARPARSQWRTALAFASIASLVLGLGFGLRRTENASAQSPAVTSPEKNPANTADQPSKSPIPPAIKSAEDSDPPHKQSRAPNTGTAVVKASIVEKTIVEKTPVQRTPVGKTGPSRSHADGLIAPNTVTYLDAHHQPAPKPRPAKHYARRHRFPHKHAGSVVAANTVTVLNPTPASKPAQ